MTTKEIATRMKEHYERFQELISRINGFNEKTHTRHSGPLQERIESFVTEESKDTAHLWGMGVIGHCIERTPDELPELLSIFPKILVPHILVNIIFELPESKAAKLLPIIYRHIKEHPAPQEMADASRWDRTMTLDEFAEAVTRHMQSRKDAIVEAREALATQENSYTGILNSLRESGVQGLDTTALKLPSAGRGRGEQP